MLVPRALFEDDRPAPWWWAYGRYPSSVFVLFGVILSLMVSLRVSRANCSEDRLPTLSASQALRRLDRLEEEAVPFGLPGLDDLVHGGLFGGQIVEIFGPPGVGKTTLCIQVACTVLRRNKRVLWVDACAPIAGPRLKQILDAKQSENDEQSQASSDELLAKFSQCFVPTLAHFFALLALQLAPTAQKPDLIVVDSLSTLLDSAFFAGGDGRRPGMTAEHQAWLDRRRPEMIVQVADQLSRLAALKNIPIMVSSNMIAKSELIPAIYGRAWEDALELRLCLFRDWPVNTTTSSATSSQRAMPTRFLSIVKASNSAVSSQALRGCVIAFDIKNEGIVERSDTVELADGPPLFPVASSGQKRGINEVIEADEESDEYGWDVDATLVTAEGLVENQATQDMKSP